MNLIQKYRNPVGDYVTCRKCGKAMTGYSKHIENPDFRFHTICNPHNPESVAKFERREQQKREFFESKRKGSSHDDLL